MDQIVDFFKKHLAGMLLIATGLFVSPLAFVDTIGLQVSDWQRRLIVDSETIPQKLILVEVDQHSLDQMQELQGIGWPWPREFYGGIADYAAKGGARATLIDILFNNETPYGESSDDAFAQTLQQAANVYLAAAVTNKHDRFKNLLQAPIAGDVPVSARRQGLLPPLEKFVSATAGLGAVNSSPDRDGIFRRVVPVFEVAGNALPLLGISTFAGSLSQPVSWQNKTLSYADKELPLDDDGMLWVNYPTKSYFQRISAYDLVYSMMAVQSGKEPLINANMFKDAYVFIGYVAPGLYDLKPTPFSARGPGVEIHMALLHSWLADDFLRPIANWLTAVLGIACALLAYLIFQLIRRVIVAISASFLLLGLMFLLSLLLFRLDFIISLPYLFLPALMVSVGVGSRRFVSESREKEFRQKSLEKMVSPHVAQWLLQDIEKRMQRTGEMREISVFFSDLEGFTTLAENLCPEKTVRIIDQYMDLMQSAILHHNGTIKQFVGDAVMAIWGAPLEQPNQAELAIKTALQAQAKLDNVEFEYEEGVSIRLKMRIGIDYGSCIVGNIGSSQRFEYAAVGDTVNRASRLEGLNKFYGTRIIVSETAWQTSKGTFFGRKLDQVLVKGKNYSVAIYEPFCEAGLESTAQKQLVKQYEKAWNEYATGNWQDARFILESLQNTFDDKPSGILLERLDILEKDPEMMGNDWNGVWKFTSK